MRSVRTIVATTAACVVLLGVATTPAHAATGVTSSRSPVTVATTMRQATSYWTKSRMINAIPVPVSATPKGIAATDLTALSSGPQGPAGKVGPAQSARGTATRATMLADPGATAKSWAGSVSAPPATTSGKVFFVGSDGLNYVCSGSTVNSAGKNVVFTAGHCVARFGQWYNLHPWIFVPGYKNGSAPYGQWSAQQLFTRTAWINGDNRAEDMGAAVMATNAYGQHIVDVVGGQGIEWNYPLAQYQFQFGYPQAAPFNGELLKYCTGNSFNDGGFNGISCNMTGGASGGPWLVSFTGTFGYLDGVNSWVFSTAAGAYKWNSPYFGNNAQDLYNTVANR